MRAVSVFSSCCLAIVLVLVSRAQADEPPASAPDGGAAAPAATADGGAAMPPPLEGDAGPSPATPPPPSSDADAGAPSSGPSGLGFTVGLRAGLALPLGTAKDSSLSDVTSSVIPFGVEVGYFATKHVYFGAYVLYGFGFAGSLCPNTADTSCSVGQWRFGANARWQLLPDARISPWMGGGLGYDIVNLSQTDSSGTVVQSSPLRGLEASLAVGADYKPLVYLGIGPFAELAAGHYAGGSSSTSLYGWLTFGLRFRTGL